MIDQSIDWLIEAFLSTMKDKKHELRQKQQTQDT